jgi:hypothetical protein
LILVSSLVPRTIFSSHSQHSSLLLLQFLISSKSQNHWFCSDLTEFTRRSVIRYLQNHVWRRGRKRRWAQNRRW